MSPFTFSAIFSASAWVSLKQIDAVARPVFKFAVLVSISTVVIIAMAINRLADGPAVDVAPDPAPATGAVEPDYGKMFAMAETGTFTCDADPADAAIVEAFMNRPVGGDNVVTFYRSTIAAKAMPATTLVVPVEPVQPLETLTIRELKKMASGKVNGYSNMKKAELISALSLDPCWEKLQEMASLPDPA